MFGKKTLQRQVLELINANQKLHQQVAEFQNSGHRTAVVHHEYDEDGGHLYYIRLLDRADPPYLKQVEVEAILDIAADGTLAGIELIDRMPPPPKSKS